MQKMTVVIGVCEGSITIPDGIKKETLTTKIMGLFDLLITSQGFTKDVMNAVEWEKAKVKKNVVVAMEQWIAKAPHHGDKTETRFVLPDMPRKILLNSYEDPDTSPPAIRIICESI